MSFDSLVARAALPALLRSLERWQGGRLTLELPGEEGRSFGRASPTSASG